MNQQKIKREKIADTSVDVLEAQIAKLRNLSPKSSSRAISTSTSSRRRLAGLPIRDREDSRFPGLASKNRQAALDNPQEFASQAARVTREKAIQQLVDGIKYEKDGTWYEITEWVEQEETVSDRLVPLANSIYDQIVVQSETERKFAE